MGTEEFSSLLMSEYQSHHQLLIVVYRTGQMETKDLYASSLKENTQWTFLYVSLCPSLGFVFNIYFTRLYQSWIC